jgi:hypothetical protein
MAWGVGLSLLHPQAAVQCCDTKVVLKGFSVANFAVKDALTEDEARLGFRALIKDGLACPSMVSLMGGISTMNNANKEVNVHE